MKRFVIIVAGGVGTRMKSDLPKQFLEIGGEPMIVKTIRCFLSFDDTIRMIISVHSDYTTHLEAIILKYHLPADLITITSGGDTRFESVKNGLMQIKDDGIVAIHDAARPFVSQRTIVTCFETAANKGNAVPCLNVAESMRRISKNSNASVNRNEYRIIQTPQCFMVSKIKQAYSQPYSESFTDDATVIEATGEEIILVDGNEENIKITTSYDMFIANALCLK